MLAVCDGKRPLRICVFDPVVVVGWVRKRTLLPVDWGDASAGLMSLFWLGSWPLFPFVGCVFLFIVLYVDLWISFVCVF